MEYIKAGWAINMGVAIDFTASNGEIKESFSLHRIDKEGIRKNQYEEAILAVGKVLEPYALYK